MSKPAEITFATTILVRDSCLCLHTQRAARALARRFDEALLPAGLRSGQFSLLMALNRPTPPAIGSVAALLAEMFPPRIRYSSMSIPYHIGTGYFGGFPPLISAYAVSRTGDPYSGLWYTWGVVLMALLVTLWGLKETHPRAA